eukprot:2365636-Prorocentrum_lima.AAC.1
MWLAPSLRPPKDQENAQAVLKKASYYNPIIDLLCKEFKIDVKALYPKLHFVTHEAWLPSLFTMSMEISKKDW